jgi:hypothetical protein
MMRRLRCLAVLLFRIENFELAHYVDVIELDYFFACFTSPYISSRIQGNYYYYYYYYYYYSDPLLTTCSFHSIFVRIVVDS